MTESVDATVEAIKKAAKAQADSEYKAEQQQTYVDLLKEQSSSSSKSRRRRLTSTRSVSGAA